ncbi:microtubule-associated protein 10 [Oryctolagus cuniculus]|uniref:microtubule-associated protein 10 n=1 Tax=Oryctolagus cuniculus TaxID=9986 RepID=UPI00048C1668|nr:microtubule-associated protein 10 [Oryctolagus cuniculus]
MAAALSEHLFSLELLVDCVRLRAGLQSPISGAGEEEEEQEGASQTRDLCPAVAFRLLDFPTLLVYPPGGPAAPAPEPRHGVISFGRGKSCLFRFHPASLHRLLLRTPLYTLLLQLPPGRPTPTPQLLGSCNVSLASAAHEVVGPAASGCSQGLRGSFPLRNRAGEQIGDIVLAYRLTDLGSRLLGHLERPIKATTCAGGVAGREVQEAEEVRSQTPQEKQQLEQLASEPSPRVAARPPGGLKTPKALKDIVSHSEATSVNRGSAENGKTDSLTCENASNGRSIGPLNQEVTELDVESNIFCPPPLFYTHRSQEKTTPARVTITIEPQVNESEEVDSAFPEKNLVNSPTHGSSSKHTNSATYETLPILKNPPQIQDIGAVNQTASNSQTEQNRVNIIRQLPLLNALLVELSVLYNQPMTSPTQIHPHLAWLYRTEDQKAPESSARSTCQPESKKEKLSMGEQEKSETLQHEKKQVENHKKCTYFEKKSGDPPKRVKRGRLLYGLTNTLRLRLKQTNPDMLVVHEKREQFRKMQAQMLGTSRMPSPKVKLLNFAEQSEKPYLLSRDKYVDPDASVAENSDTARQISGVFDELSTNKETKLECVTETMTVGCGAVKANNDSSKETVSPINSVMPEEFIHTNILGGKMGMRIQSPFNFQQDAVDGTVDKEVDDKLVKTTDNDILIGDVSESRPSQNSCPESASELKYSDDFSSPCYSEDFCTTEDSSRSLQANDCRTAAEDPKYSHCTSKSGGAKLLIRENSSEKSSILSPPFSSGSPVHSYKRSHILKTRGKSLEEASSISSSDSSSSHQTKKQSHTDQNGMYNCKVIKGGEDISVKTRTNCKALEKNQSPQTSQVSSYLPSNLSELELNVLDSSTSDHFEEDSDDVGPLSVSKQCKDIRELVINKLPGYTV